jgi:hypothetical protein
MLIGFAIGALCDCPPPCQLQVLQRLGLVATSAKVISEFRRNLGRVIAPSCLLPLRDAAMEFDAPACRDAVVKHLLIDRVMETEAGRHGTVGPSDRHTRRDELLVTREPCAACLNLANLLL